MDTLANLIVHYGKTEQTLDLTTETNWSEPLFSFPELGKCTLTFNSSLPNITLYIQTLHEDEFIILQPGATITLVKSEPTPYSYIPDTFSLHLKLSPHTTYTGQFIVTPNHVNLETIQNMRNCINDYAQGLSQNEYIKKRMNLNHSTLLQLTPRLQNALRYLKERPLTSFSKQYTHSKTNKKTSSKSERYALQKVPHPKLPYYTLENQLTHDTDENRYFKHLLLSLNHKLSLITFEELTVMLQRENDLFHKQQQLEAHYHQSINHYNASTTSYTTGKQVDTILAEREQLMQRIKQKQKQQQQLHALKSELYQLLHHSYLSSLKPSTKVPKQVLHHPAYLDLHQALAQTATATHLNSLLPSSHQTTKLFEYYGYLLLFKLLQDHDFEYESGWYLEQVLYSKHATTFRHESGYTAILRFDTQLPRLFEARHRNQSQLVSINSNSTQPDLLIELYDESKQFVRCLIVEMKFRQLRSLYSKETELDVFRQLSDYRMLQFYTPSCERTLTTEAVCEVIVLYPETSNSRYICDTDYHFKFIPINPSTLTPPLPLLTSFEHFITELSPL